MNPAREEVAIRLQPGLLDPGCTPCARRRPPLAFGNSGCPSSFDGSRSQAFMPARVCLLSGCNVPGGSCRHPGHESPCRGSGRVLESGHLEQALSGLHGEQDERAIATARPRALVGCGAQGVDFRSGKEMDPSTREALVAAPSRDRPPTDSQGRAAAAIISPLNDRPARSTGPNPCPLGMSSPWWQARALQHKDEASIVVIDDYPLRIGAERFEFLTVLVNILRDRRPGANDFLRPSQCLRR
jgi:hypothetical protein